MAFATFHEKPIIQVESFYTEASFGNILFKVYFIFHFCFYYNVLNFFIDPLLIFFPTFVSDHTELKLVLNRI